MEKNDNHCAQVRCMLCVSMSLLFILVTLCHSTCYYPHSLMTDNSLMRELWLYTTDYYRQRANDADVMCSKIHKHSKQYNSDFVWTNRGRIFIQPKADYVFLLQQRLLQMKHMQRRSAWKVIYAMKKQVVECDAGDFETFWE